MSESRKLAAILAVDVVGYSRLMGEDETGTARAVREHREAAAPIVRGLGGRLVKTMGDGVLLEFPSVVAAVECAILMQKQMAERNTGVAEAKRILYRIGVNLGDVLIEGDDIVGDGVNIAARLEGIAEPGGVCTSGSAYDHVRGRIDAEFVDLGERTLKNIAQPVRVYALGVGEIARASASTPLRPAVPVKPPAPALLGIAALLIVIAAGGWYWFIANRPAAVATGPPAPVASNAAAPAEAAHLSIVVLPFKNLSGDPGQDYFADGITDNLTTDLSRIRNSFVIASTTAFTYKGKTVFPSIFVGIGVSLARQCLRLVRVDLERLFEQGSRRIVLVLDPKGLTQQGLAAHGEIDRIRVFGADALFRTKAETNDFLSIRRAHEAKILELVDRAIALAPDNVAGYAAKSGYLQIARRWDEPIRAARRSTRRRGHRQASALSPRTYFAELGARVPCEHYPRGRPQCHSVGAGVTRQRLAYGEAAACAELAVEAPPNPPCASRCGDDHVAERGRGGLTIPESLTLRARGITT